MAHHDIRPPVPNLRLTSDDPGAHPPIAKVQQLLVSIGAALRLWQYAGGASLWLDELAIARNIVDRSAVSLLRYPLDYDQVAPRGFLLAEKLLVSAFGASELVLRLLPLACALASLVLFQRIAERLLSTSAAVLALALFAFGFPFILDGALVKQYAGDVAATLLLALIALELLAKVDRHRALAAGFVGVVVVWFSQAATLVIAGLGVGLVLGALFRREGTAFTRRMGPLVPVLALWAAGVALAVVAGVRSMTPETVAYMHRFWHAGFMLWPPRSLRDVLWVGIRLEQAFGSGGLQYPWPAFYVGLFGLGLWSLWSRRPHAALLVLGPIIVTLAAAIGHEYPFAQQLIHFLLPLFLLAVAEGADRVCRLVSAGSPRAGFALMALVTLPPAFALARTPPVFRIEETRPVLAFVQAHRESGDAIYVHYGAWQAVAFYGQQYGLHASEYVIGGCHQATPRKYLEELDRYRGQSRMWVVFSHTVPQLGEREAILHYLSAIGRQRDTISTSSNLPWPSVGPAAYLYDLSDPVRLRAATAASIPLPPSVTPDARFSCFRGPTDVQALSPDRGGIAVRATQ